MRPSEKRWTAALFAVALGLGGLLGHARAQATRRCDQCGMHIREDSIFRAGGTTTSGASVVFDTPKCYFRYHFARGPLRDGWMIDRASRTRREATRLHYLLGADLMGPMGRDLIPVDGREAAESLGRAHHARRVLGYAEVTREIVDALFGGGHRHHAH